MYQANKKSTAVTQRAGITLGSIAPRLVGFDAAMEPLSSDRVSSVAVLAGACVDLLLVLLPILLLCVLSSSIDKSASSHGHGTRNISDRIRDSAILSIL